MVLIYCYDCEQVKYSFPQHLSCLSCGSQLVDEIPSVYSQDEEEEDLEEEDEDEEEGTDFDQQSVLQRLTNNVQHGSSIANVNFHFMSRRGSLSMEEVKFRQWVMRHLLWNGDMTQMPIEILSSPLLSQFATTEEEGASYMFRNWVMCQALLPQQEDRATAFVQWIKKHILGDRTELDYRRKMRQALSVPLQEITQQESSAYRTRVFRVLGEQPHNQFNNSYRSTTFSDFEREFHFPDPYLDLDDGNDTEDDDDDDDDDDYISSIYGLVEYTQEDEEEDNLNTSDEEFLDFAEYAEADRLSIPSNISDDSSVVHPLPGTSFGTLGFLYDFIGDNQDGDDSGSVNFSVLDELISEIRTRTGLSRTGQQAHSTTHIMQSLTEKSLSENDPEYQTECSICQEIFAKEKLYSLPCHHIYHAECITQWVRLKPTCPICRYDLATSPTQGPSMSSQDNADIQEALREFDRQERQFLSDDEEDAEDERVSQEALRELERQERELFGADYDEEPDDDDDSEEEEEEEHMQNYIDTSTHIRTILERWPTGIWSDEEDEDEFLSPATDFNPFLFDSNRTSSGVTRSRRIINPDDVDDHLWSPSSFHTTDLSPNIDRNSWHGSISPRSTSSDSSAHYLGSANDQHHTYDDDSIRAVTSERSRHNDQDQQLYFSDDMDIE